MIKKWLNAVAFEKKYEINNMPSMTVPDQTMTVRQILDRYARGLPLGGQKLEIWEGEENDLPDIRTLDYAERQELAEQYKNEILDTKMKIEDAKKRKNETKTKVDETKSKVGADDIPGDGV